MNNRKHLDDMVAYQDRGSDLVIKHPVTGEPTDIVLTIVGPDSDTARRARLQMEDGLYSYHGKPSAAELDRMYIEQLARLVCRGNLGEGVKFSFSNVVKFLTEHHYARVQVAEFSQRRDPYFMRVI